jgi:aspartyl-tRNA(Asn)/glutamyl-tRNA(Gln) amidotransferase subunit C
VRYHRSVPTITREEVQRLARLARLELSEGQMERFTRQLGDILEFARQVNAVDTTAVDVSDRSDGEADAARDDRVQPSLDRCDALALAPDADDATGLFKVPRVLNG